MLNRYRFRRAAPPLLLGAMLLTGCAGLAAPQPSAPAPLADDVEAARALLQRERAAAWAIRDPAARARRVAQLGMWAAADSLLRDGGRTSPELLAAEAELRMRQHRYDEAGRLVEALLRSDPAHRHGTLLRARLAVQAWELPWAAESAESLLRRRPRDLEAALLLGRVRLLEKRYPEALQWARQIQRWHPRSPGGHLLEADVHFWSERPAEAEAPLRRALALDPLDPDARFAYGYALWRRVDAMLLSRMAAQWNLALEVDPLHYATHWHFGNGHTHLTYADYAQPEDTVVRVRLARADSLLAGGGLAAALEVAQGVERDFPRSALPPMLRGSAFYLAHEMERGARLDSAEAAFRSVLASRPNYGPAHNGLAAVIKQRQFQALSRFDSLEAEIARTPPLADSVASAVFPDFGYYPGSRVRRMAAQQLGPAAAYLPLIHRQGARYRIPPLHRSLAEAMGSAYFRTATTFDNRQWMDIRGVGSGAAGIEYVERGSHQERNVLLHEFVHLFHQTVFTDAENRRVRQLYHDAMREGRTLDYYAANNEHEFLAQAFPAALSPVRVHPLNHKSMNTRADLLRRDPATAAFVDGLLKRQRAYLAGDSAVFASNWAQVYVNLSEKARRGNGAPAERVRTAAALLDTALVHDPAYIPAMLSYAALRRDQEHFAEAQRWLARAEVRDPFHAPTWTARAALLGTERGFTPEALEAQRALLGRALQLEQDPAERARLNEQLRHLLLAHAKLPEAIAAAEEYAREAPTVSTYLRDRRDEAAAFAHALRASLGHAESTLPFFREMVARRPQDYRLREQLADALTGAGRAEEAAEALREAQRILRAGGSASASFAIRLAEIQLLRGDTAAARAEVSPLLDGSIAPPSGDLRYVRVLIALGEHSEANRVLAAAPPARGPRAEAELAFTRARLSQWRGDPEGAGRRLREALALDPYHLSARAQLVRLLRAQGAEAEAAVLLQDAGRLPLPLGPDLLRQVQHVGTAPVAATPDSGARP